MSTGIKTAAAGATALVLGIGLMLAADRFGWLDRSPAPTAQVSAGMCEHRIMDADCPFCHPELLESLGFCAGHGVPEAICSRCKPSLQPAFEAINDWCAEHGLPESQCVICNPDLAKDGLPDPRADHDCGANDGRAQAPVQLVSGPATPRSERPPSVTCKTTELRVQFVSHDIADKAGIEHGTAERRAITETLTCNATVAYDANRYARLSPRAPGVVHEVRADLGQRVRRGDALAVIESAELGAAKADYLQAGALVKLWEANAAREAALVEQGVSIEAERLEASSRLAEGRITLTRAGQRLRELGLSEEQVAQVATTEDPSSLLDVTAPFDGVVVERAAVVGEVVGPGAPIAAVADTSAMWAVLDVQESDLARIAVGQPVVLAVDGLRGETFGGRVVWAGSEVDPRSRTLRARAQIDNGRALLRANMFGRATVGGAEARAAVTVPKSSVQWEGCCNVVFERLSPALYQPRKVRLGYDGGDWYEVKEGLTGGETIATQGSFLLKTEILKGSIGAGCCEVDHLAK